MHPTSIRRAISSDVAALSVFAASVFPLGCPETAEEDLAAYVASELSPAKFLAYIEDPNVIILLAEASGVESRKLVAYMVVALRSAHPELSIVSPAEFRKLYVDAAYHGTGLASAMIHCALSILHAEGPRAIWLSVFSQNPRAISFYKKWNFQIAGTQEFVVGSDRQQDFLMLRDANTSI